jgi:hypothetical protein
MHTADRQGGLVAAMSRPNSVPRYAGSLIQINAAAGSRLNVARGNGPDAVQFQNSKA